MMERHQAAEEGLHFVRAGAPPGSPKKKGEWLLYSGRCPS